MRQLEPREVYLLLYGADALGAHWKLRALRKELMADPEIQAIWRERNPGKGEESK
jgi:hypothetical protein